MSAACQGIPPCGDRPRGATPRVPLVQHSEPVLPRRSSLAFLLLVLLAMTGCTTVTPRLAPDDGRPLGVRAPLAPDGPTPTAPMLRSLPRARSALVRTGPTHPRHTAKARPPRRHRSRPRVTPPQRVRRAVPRAYPAPRRPRAPHLRLRMRRPVVQVPQVRPLPYPQQMRQLCRTAEKVTAPDIVSLCRHAWGRPLGSGQPSRPGR